VTFRLWRSEHRDVHPRPDQPPRLPIPHRARSPLPLLRLHEMNLAAVADITPSLIECTPYRYNSNIGSLYSMNSVPLEE
jgi:hypothetical protein